MIKGKTENQYYLVPVARVHSSRLPYVFLEKKSLLFFLKIVWLYVIHDLFLFFHCMFLNKSQKKITRLVTVSITFLGPARLVLESSHHPLLWCDFINVTYVYTYVYHILDGVPKILENDANRRWFKIKRTWRPAAYRMEAQFMCRCGGSLLLWLPFIYARPFR